MRNGPAVDRELAQLTPQEQRILGSIGLLTQRTAGADLEMFLAEKTVKNYVSAMLAKLGLSSRTQAALFAAKRHGT